MAAVPIYVWNGSAWQEIGPTIPASPIAYQTSAPASPSTGDIWVDSDGDVTTGSQQFQRFRFVASGGETTISGADADGAILAYTAGLEQVILNGAVLVRGQDYTATDGTNITGLSPALVASDVLEVFSFIAFTVANTYTQSQVDGLVAAAPGMKLVVPSSADNGTVSASGAVSFTSASSVSLNDCFSSTYDNYKIVCDFSSSTDQEVFFRLRASGVDLTTSVYRVGEINLGVGIANALGGVANTLRTSITLSNNGSSFSAGFVADVIAPNKAQAKFFNSQGTGRIASINVAQIQQATAYTGFTIFCTAATTMSGTIRVYGYKN